MPTPKTRGGAVSNAFSLTTIVGALEATSEFIGGPPRWEAVCEEQQQLLARYALHREALAQISSLQSWAKRTADEINQILAEHGFDIRLDQWEDDGQSFGTLSINDVTVLWSQTGVLATPIKGHQAFSLDSSAIVSALRVVGHDHPVIRLRTKGGEVVCISIHDEPQGPFEMVEAINRLQTGRRAGNEMLGKVTLPMVKLRQMVNLGWLTGLGTQSPTGWWQVAQALQEVRFGMNHLGARAKEATAVAVMRGVTRPSATYVVDRPFLIWFEQPGVKVPIFQAYVTEVDWVDPGDLSAL